MLSEGRRSALRLSFGRSISEPGGPVSTVPFLPHHQSPSLCCSPSVAATDEAGAKSVGPQFFPSKVVSMPNSPSNESVTLQRSLLFRKARVMEPCELARRLTRSPKLKSFLLLDLRSFVAYNLRHVRSSINLNCSDRFNRRRLQQRRATVVEMAASPAGREILKKRCFKEVVIYDDVTRDLETLPPHHPVFLVLSALLEDNRDPILLKGGFDAFEHSFPELCEDALMRTRSDSESSTHLSATEDGWDSVPSVPGSPNGTENAIDRATVTEILPFLFLGNVRDAHDTRVLENLGISRVLNVTSQPPPVLNGASLHFKTLPAMDSGQQNLRQYFSEAISYIDEARELGTGVIVHCQAGVSRSPTIVLAYLMKHTRMTMLDAYKLVKSLRPIISPNLNFMGQLVEWEATLQASKLEPDCKPCNQCQWQKVDTKKMSSATCQV